MHVLLRTYSTDKTLRYFTFFLDLLADVFRAVLGIVNRVFKDFVKELFKRLLSRLSLLVF